MNEIRTRTLTGVFFVLVLIFAIIGTLWTLSGLFFLFTLFGLGEYFTIVSSKKKRNPLSALGFLLGICIYWSIVLLATGTLDHTSLLWFIPILIFGGIWSLFSTSSSPIADLSLTLFGSLLVAAPFAFLSAVAMITGSYEYEIVLGFFIMLWANDTGAYLIGIKFGKRKLFERISPKKTWEGFFGGVFVCFISAYIISRFYDILYPEEWLVLALLVSVFSNLGDLFESLLKRTFQVKDSGKILPGHGGILDRFDGLILAVPMIYFYLMVK